MIRGINTSYPPHSLATLKWKTTGINTDLFTFVLSVKLKEKTCPCSLDRTVRLYVRLTSSENECARMTFDRPRYQWLGLPRAPRYTRRNGTFHVIRAHSFSEEVRRTYSRTVLSRLHGHVFSFSLTLRTNVNKSVLMPKSFFIWGSLKSGECN
jgi:hypothetical protein